MENYFDHIEKFINKIPGNSEKRIFSYAFRIESDVFEKALENIGRIEKKFFYTGKSKDQMSFLGIESVLDVEHNGEQRVTKSAASVQHLQSTYINNFEELGLFSIPLFLGGMKFSPEDVDTLWENYSDSD